MPHTVSFIQDEKDPSVQHEFLVNVGPLGIKEEEPDPNRSAALRDRSFAMLNHPPAAPTAATDAASLAWDDVVMVTGLKNRDDLNDSAARVLRDEPRADGRIPIEMFLGMERVWIKRANLLGPIPDVAALTHEPYSRMSDVERTDVGMFFFANQNSTRIPGVRGRSVSLVDREPVTIRDSVPDPAPALAPSFSTRAGMIDKVEMLDQTVYESIEAPAPAPAPAAVDRRAAARDTLRNMMQEHCPRPHYCIYCGSEGLYGDKCVPCGFYRGSHCFGPNGPLQKGDTLMGRKLAYVKWPWQGEPDAPYVRAGAATADVAPEPKSKYAVDPPPVRAMTRDEVLGPNPCAEVCPKYPQSTAARLVAYVLGKVDHVTPGVESDFRYYLQTNEDWRKTRKRIIEIHEAGEENAAEVFHEEYLVGHHNVCETEENRPAYLPADWDGMKRRVKARQKKDRAPGALAYPDSDADEEDVAAYLEAMALRA